MNKKIMTALYSAAHFFVDLACAFLIFRYVYKSRSDSVCLLYYNFCAFALQMPFGILIDRFGKGHGAAASGCALIAAAYGIPSGTAAAVIAGIGNALFHVGGGVYVLDEYNKTSGALGIFVSPGAIGLYIGTLWGRADEPSAIIPIAAMMILAAAILIMPAVLHLESRWGRAEEDPLSMKADPKIISAAAMFFAVVVIRSFGGFAVSFPWKTAGLASLAAVLVTAGGKAAGGFVSDGIGKKYASFISMTAAAILYIFSRNMICGILAVLLFNMSMPITLRAAADIFTGGRGFSFGLLTFAMFIGYIPSYVTQSGISISSTAMCILCLVSMILLLTGFYLCGKGSAVPTSTH